MYFYFGRFLYWSEAYLLSAYHTTVAHLYLCSNIIPHSAHTSAGLHKLICQTYSSQLTDSFIPSSYYSTVLFSIPPLCHSLTLPCTNIYRFICLPAFLGHSALPTFIHTTPCFVFMLARWGDGGIDDFTHASTRGEVGGAGNSILESLSLIRLSIHK